MAGQHLCFFSHHTESSNFIPSLVDAVRYLSNTCTTFSSLTKTDPVWKAVCPGPESIVTGLLANHDYGIFPFPEMAPGVGI